jgi:hypothetical protein
VQHAPGGAQAEAVGGVEGETGEEGVAMTAITIRHQRGYFFVVSPDIKIMKFKSRPEARDWCKAHYPGSPITEIGRDESRRVIAC